jgi:hypothetical protein
MSGDRMPRPIVRYALIAVVVLAALGGLLAGGVHLLLEHGEPAPRPPEVPASWRDVRTGLGHTRHLAAADVTCADCHPADRAFEQPDTGACRRCHERIDDRMHPPGDNHGCVSCHEFRRDVPASPDACRRCHVPPASQRPAPRHFEQDCATCHRPHDAAPLAPTCAGCHLDRPARHGAGSVDGARCLDCHDAHGEAAVTSQRCLDCHQRRSPAITPRALAGGHTDCATCHQGHDFRAASAARCESCHRAVPVMGAERSAAHRACTSCHDQHDVAAASARCATCHGDLPSHHPASGGAVSCTSCHPPHRPGAVAAVAPETCARCHRAAGPRAFHAGGLTCDACHAPHRASAFRTAGDGSCARCHSPQATATAAAKAHTACTTCHVSAAHEPTRPRPTCASCHTAEARTAPPGHAACGQCHQTHGGAQRPEATCASCHADRAAALHGDLPSGCPTCHRPHGPGGVASPPACVTCHDAAGRPGLHAAPGHQRCADCHGAHRAPSGDRTTCLACHTGQRQHQPAARSCSGCHPFGS